MTADIDAILAQRAELKRRDPEAILLFRVQDSHYNHYRAFHEDATAITECVKLGWTEATFAFNEKPPWIGILPGSLDFVLSRLVAAGKRAAVCEPAKGPAPAGAKVERVVTEGDPQLTDREAAECGEWLRHGTTVYELEEYRDGRRRSQLRNRWSASVQRGPATPESECEAVARKMRAAPRLIEACRFAVKALGRQTEFWKADAIIARVVADIEEALADAEPGK